MIVIIIIILIIIIIIIIIIIEEEEKQTNNNNNTCNNNLNSPNIQLRNVISSEVYKKKMTRRLRDITTIVILSDVK